MPRDLFSNQGSTTVSSGGTTAPSQGTTESWTVASSSTFPAASNAASPATQFYVSDPALPSETILVTNVSGTTWSVTRGADGTTPVAHTAGFTVRNVVTAVWLTEIEDRAKTNFFNVVEYGADPTGSADSSTGVQAAMTAAQTFASSNKRATVFFPQGQYKLNSTVRVVGGNVTIDAYGAYIFAGSNTDLFRDWSSQDTSYTLNGNGLTILGGTWDCLGQNWGTGSNSSLNAAGFSAFTISNSSNVTFRDVTVRNVYKYHGIDMNTCRDVTVENCRFEGFQNNFTWHADCRLATTANIALTGNVAIDGLTSAAGDRILVKNQTTASQNGVYVASASGWSRATDMDVSAEFNNAAVTITSGTTNGGNSWYQSAYNPTVGTTSIAWSQSVDSIGGAASRDFSEAIQLDRFSGAPASINVTIQGCYMGPAIDGSGLGGFGKLAGTHTSATTDYTNVRVANCFVDSPLNVGINGYHWSNSVITGNTINTSANWEAIVVDSAVGTVVSNNTISHSGVGGAVKTGFGTTLKSDAHGIRFGNKDSGCTDCVVSGNVITGNSSSSEGIQLQAATRCKVVGNNVYSVGLHGVYISSVCTDCSVVDNTVVGAGRFDGTTKGSIGLSGSANVGTHVSGNTVRKFGSGNEAIGAIATESGSTLRTVIGFNDVGTDWGSGPFDAYNWNSNTHVVVQWDAGVTLSANATAITSSTLTDVAGLTIPNIPAGVWFLQVYLPVTFSGTVTSTFAIKSSGGPATSAINVDAYRARSTSGGNLTSWGSTAAYATTLTGTTVVIAEGGFVSTGTGALAAQLAISAGTNVTPLAGASVWLKCGSS